LRRGEFPRQPEADHPGNQHGTRLPQEGRLRLDSPHSPPHDTKAVDHGGVGIGADQGVGANPPLPIPFDHHSDSAKVLEIDLVTDAGIGRDHAKIAERPLSPAEKLVALPVALELQVGIGCEGRSRAVAVHLHRMVDDKVGRLQGIDPCRIAPQAFQGRTHGGKVGDGRDSSKILEQDPGRHELDLLVREGLGMPVAELHDIIPFDRDPVLAAQEVFQKNFDRVGEP